ncbi:tetratricopeptide repeat-containing glycosyltransferase family protein [Rugamonas sp.]|uniref:tetratricopeptide repeat-containing glycosyltransferase family protein n=1 Tax=Rugamonas sp. TaxID=1926287 RepID=UPI0025FD089C|nr:tetratricopeptide repeat-containing glycosyltransferase family protein [Rugamonas sp.]
MNDNVNNPAAGGSPSTAQATMERAVALHQRGELAQAAALYLEVIDAEPDHPHALHMLGVYALQSGDLQAALDLIERAAALLPHEAAPQLNLGAVLKRLERYDAALACLRRALEIEPEHVTALNNYGSTLLAMGRGADALPWLERALRLDPAFADGWNNLGNALHELQRHAEALLCLDRALLLQAQHPQALFNRANTLQMLNRSGEALRSYALALRHDPEHVDANVNMAVCRLLDGDLEHGWPQFEWRWRKPAYQALRPAAPPLWHGQGALAGKTLLVYAEQGLGDTLQFCRYVPLLAARGARVILRVQPALVTLLATLAGAHQVLADDAPLPPCDLQCPLMSLPLAFATRLSTIPADTPYLRADARLAAAWGARLGSDTTSKPRIGIAWAGSAGHANDRQRSMALIELRRIVTPAADFISLQKDARAVDMVQLDGDGDNGGDGGNGGGGIRQFAALQTDFAATAALVAQMDLVICVDTSIAHLAGALGKPVWLLLPFAPDWRWMLGRDDSPWYPTMRLFRQPRAGDWDAVLEQVVAALGLRLAGHAAPAIS